MMLSLILLLLSSSNYAYEKSIIKYDPKQYHRYIKPQLYNITNEYQDFLEYVRPNFKSHFSLRAKILNLYSEVYGLKKECTLFTENCVEKLNNFNQNFNSLYKVSINLENDFDNNIKSFYENAEAQSRRIKLLTLIHQLHTRINFFTNTVNINPSQSHNIDNLKNSILDLYEKYHLYIFELMPENVQQDLKYGHTFFFKTIDIHILAENRFHLLKERINDLNNSWHELNVQLYKRKNTVNKRAKSQLNNINNKWISILKMIISNKE